MSDKNVRKGVTNARFNEKNAGILFSEFAIIGIFGGFYFESWIIGGLILFFLMVGFIAFKPAALILSVLLSLGWGFVGYSIGSLFDSNGAMIVLSILGFLCGLGLHLSGLEWIEDINIGSCRQS